MGYFDHIKADTTLTSKQKKAAFMSQLRENKIAVYPSLMVSVLKSLGICKSELADRLQVSSSDISRITTKSFHLSPRKLICLCAEILQVSCHEFLFGDNGTSILPVALACVCKTVENWSDYLLDECLKKLQYIKKTNTDCCGPYIPELEDILSERIEEAAADQYCTPEDYLSEEACSYARVSMRNYVDGYVTTLQTSTIMYIAFLTSNTFDYYVVPDYTAAGPIGYLEGDKVITVTNRLIVQIISTLLQMPPYLRANCIGHISYMDMRNAL